MNIMTTFRNTFKGAFWLSNLLVLSGTLSAATFTVTNTNNAGAGSLFDAIAQVNAGVGSDTIAFNIPGAGVHTIQPPSDLPAIIKPNTLVDGYTQPGTSVNTDPLATNAVVLIQINGSNYTVGDGNTTGNGLTLGSGSTGSTIRGLIVNQWLLNGIFVTGSPNSKIYGNFIGASPDGLSQAANRTGVRIAGSTGVLVGSSLVADRNLFAGSFEFFVRGACLRIESGNTVVKGNLIGLDRTGTTALGNSIAGITVTAVGGNVTIGGTTVAERNVISGHIGMGILVNASGPNTILGNYVGTDVLGTNACSNGTGIVITGGAGGPATGNILKNNLISGNYVGVRIGTTPRPAASIANNTRLDGNLIGTDASGLASLGNEEAGVRVCNANNFIGGPLVSQRNIISGNAGDGIIIDDHASSTTVQGNYIGVAINGTNSLGNGGNGILIGHTAAVQLANNNLIGGLNAGEGNVISGNGKDGIRLQAYVKGNTIINNLIGTDASGTLPVPNGLAGIRLLCAPQNSLVGNTIAFNPFGVIEENCKHKQEIN